MKRHFASAVFGLCLFTPVTAFGQAVYGSIVGTVTDSSSAAIPNAKADARVAFGSARFTMSPQWAMEVGIGGAREDPLFSQRTASVRVRRMF